ncbi:cytochrome c peroxidase, partial [Sedimenticola sp.]|uniref:c-type cytochrome n=1 Tax=Sedimenticola sp. TaxID=1940285 RepID=UPI00258D0434
MKQPCSRKTLTAIVSGCLTTIALGGAPLYAANPCAAKPMNPCAAKSMNPCAAKSMNPCAAKPMNPCAAKSNNDAVTRPKDYKPYQGNPTALLAEGEKLFKDTSLSTNGMSCNTCHNNNGMFQASFAQPYPHYVQMANDQFQVKAVHADEMVQLCMVSPMAAQPLPWDSRELAALATYVTEQQKGFAKQHKTAAMNPCAAKNPCAANNPCAAKNPCAANNPCAAKNPCAANNPCAAKN